MVTERQAAEILGRSWTTLRNMRLASEPIPSTKRGKSVWYRLGDLVVFLIKK